MFPSCVNYDCLILCVIALFSKSYFTICQINDSLMFGKAYCTKYHRNHQFMFSFVKLVCFEIFPACVCVFLCHVCTPDDCFKQESGKEIIKLPYSGIEPVTSVTGGQGDSPPSRDRRNN